jgi:uncharacterized protein (TIGR02001 family)
MNKKSLALISALVVGAFSAQAQSVPAPASAVPTVSVTATPSIVSQYMFRGQRLGGPSFQPAVELGYGDVVAGVWSNFPLADKVPGVSDPEFDFYGSDTVTLNPASSVVVGFTYYYYPRADLNAGLYRSTFEPNIAFNYTLAGLKLTPKLYWDFMLKGPTYEFTAAYAVPLKEIGTELDFSAVGGTYLVKDASRNFSPAVKAWGNYWLLSAAAPFQLTKESKLTVGFAYTKGSNAFAKQGSFPKSSISSAVGRGVVTISYAYSF